MPSRLVKQKDVVVYRNEQSYSHNATVELLQDGQLVVVVQEQKRRSRTYGGAVSSRNSDRLDYYRHSALLACRRPVRPVEALRKYAEVGQINIAVAVDVCIRRACRSWGPIRAVETKLELAEVG